MDIAGIRENWAATERLHQAGVEMMRQRMVRESPEDAALAEARFFRWLFREDEPVPGDVAGPVHISHMPQ